MKSSYSPSARRTPASGVRSTSGLVPYSRTPSTYSGRSKVNKRNLLLVVAKSVARVFGACLMPPEPDKNDSKAFGCSEEFKASSGKFVALDPTLLGAEEEGDVQIESANDKHLGVEFQSEIRTLAQVEHLNLVKFYGYLEHEDERIVLVEYVPNGTLREHLDCKHENFIDFAVRVDIAVDVAHAVTYLHMYTGRRPIEAKREMKERITAKWVQSSLFLHNPLCFSTQYIQAIKKFAEGNAIVILDPKLERSAANNLALEKILELASQCLAPGRQSRPSMRKCAEILWSIRKDYKEQSAADLLMQDKGGEIKASKQARSFLGIKSKEREKSGREGNSRREKSVISFKN
ncbi:hypothetical protein SADUNF_Sadunf02G0134900 [Salix dunnii]|uniref:Serine-threonine/tyrosine-protein kinase catalytic domain-containing protein n=1 Tax=Salix dunnii TaxID=1413687 RepID=A0A835THZ1_9ROSI|nr:hypothetical protein SADUNF_Sadunf02G0134900 [Salix dunnii]